MKRPWLSVAVFCFVLSSILIFSIIFGGYTNLLRTQNRIGATKDYMTAQCQERLDLVPELIAMSQGVKAVENTDQINDLVQESKIILARVNSQEKLLEKDLISAFENSQVQLSREINSLVLGLKTDEKINGSKAFADLEKKIKTIEANVFYISNRYNKEARYFNERKQGILGFLVVKLFRLEHISFLEITANLFEPGKLKG